MMKKSLILLILIALFVSCSSDSVKNDNNATTSDIKNIAIPFREHGYSQHAAQLIVSQKELDTFITQIGNGNNWNNKTEVLEKLQNENIDFKTNNLLFYRITEGSGSIKLQVKNDNITIDNDKITITIERTVPQVGTADMAYYALAYRVNKKIETITFDNKMQKVVIENKKSDMIVPQNCIAWFDGCNNCTKDVGCTEMACLAYNPQDFQCIKWER